MKTGERKALIINCTYFTILSAAAFTISKYGLPMVTPFVTVFAIAYLLKGPICFLSGGPHLNQKVTVILPVLLFYSTAGPLIALLCIRMSSQGKAFIVNLPTIHISRAEPVLAGISSSIKQSILRMNPSPVGVLKELEGHLIRSTGQMVSGLPISVMGWISGSTSSLPDLFINLLLMVMVTSFTAVDYDRLTSPCLLQMGEKSRGTFLKIQAYVVGTLFICICFYALITSITFVGLVPGLIPINMEYSLLTAFSIAVFGILPVLGAGGTMISWTITTAITGDHKLVPGFPIVYLAITIIHNIIEPKIVGSQIDLHPVVTLVSTFVGMQLFGVSGFLGFPIGPLPLRHLNDTGTARLFRTA